MTPSCVYIRVIISLSFLAAQLLAKINPIRKHETLFANSTLISGWKVTCENLQSSHVLFPAEAWVCYNMKISGKRLRYWYIPGFGADEGCSDGASRFDSRNDLAELCRHMMRKHGTNKELWAAYVNKSSCNPSDDQRVIFTIKNGSFGWETVFKGKGYVIDFRCMAVD